MLATKCFALKMESFKGLRRGTPMLHVEVKVWSSWSFLPHEPRPSNQNVITLMNRFNIIDAIVHSNLSKIFFMTNAYDSGLTEVFSDCASLIRRP